MNCVQKVDRVLMNLSFQDVVREDQRLKEDLGFDSLKMVEVIVALEDAFGIEIDESDLDPTRLNTVSDLYHLMGRYERVRSCYTPF